MRTLWLILLLIVTLLTAALALSAKGMGDEPMLKVMGITSALCLLAFGILAMINGQRQKIVRQKPTIRGIQKLPRR